MGKRQSHQWPGWLAWQRIPLLIIALVTLAPIAEAGSSTHEPPRIYRSPYFATRGDTGIAEADYEEAIFYNPAGLAQGKGIYKLSILASPQVEVSNSTKDLARKIGAEEADVIKTMRQAVGKHQTLAAGNFTGILLRRAALGVYGGGTVKTLVSKSEDEGGLEVLDAYADQNLMLTFSLAESFFSDHLYLGVTAKYLERTVGELSFGLSDVADADALIEDQDQYTGKGKGTGADFGLMYRTQGRMRFSFGATVKDIGDTAVIPDAETNVELKLRQTVNVGFSLEPRTKTSAIKLLADFRDVTNRYHNNLLKKVHLGGELSVMDFIGIMGGLHQGYPTGGLYFDIRFLRLDLGMYTMEVGERVGARPDQRFVFRLQVAL